MIVFILSPLFLSLSTNETVAKQGEGWKKNGNKKNQTHSPACLKASGNESSPVPNIALTIWANACSGLRLLIFLVRSAKRYVSS